MKLISKIFDRIKYQLFNSRDYSSEKIFLIGLSKTGTTSICDALQILGYNSIHFPPIIKLKPTGLTFCWPWYLERYNAFGDIPVSFFYKDLDNMYPNAKFILSYRAKDQWLESAEKHFSVPSRDHFVALLHEKLYGSDIFDYDLFHRSFDQYHEDVSNYFKGRDNFLRLDIYNDDPWNKLCKFLNKEHPQVAFPKSNSRRKLSEYELNQIITQLNLPKSFTKDDIIRSFTRNGISKDDIDPTLLFSLLTKNETGHPNVIGYYKQIISKHSIKKNNTP